MIIIPNAVLSYQSSAPISPVLGQAWVNSTTNIFSVWTASAWQNINIDLSNYVTNSSLLSFLSTASNLPVFSSIQVPTTTINYQADSYNLVLADAGKTIQMDKPTLQNINIPVNASVSFDIGTKIDIIQTGEGVLTINASPGVSLYSENNKNRMLDRYCGATLIKTGTNEWILIGAIRP